MPEAARSSCMLSAMSSAHREMRTAQESRIRILFNRDHWGAPWSTGGRRVRRARRQVTPSTKSFWTRQSFAHLWGKRFYIVNIFTPNLLNHYNKGRSSKCKLFSFLFGRWCIDTSFYIVRQTVSFTQWNSQIQ